jgi:hypothetical protein
MEYVTLELSPQDMATLDKALGAMPFREVAPLIARINEQISKQRQAAANGEDAR